MMIFNKIDKLQDSINKLRPLKREELDQLRAYYKIVLTYSSNALDGNFLTETETKIVIEDGIAIGGSSIRDHLEAIGHAEAYNLLYEFLDSEITEACITEFHRLFYQKIDADNAGIYRTVRAPISGASKMFPIPKIVPALMESLPEKLEIIKKVKHPIVYAALAHYHLTEIQPFIDGNGRTARLLMNLCLMKDGYPITIIPPVLRRDYLEALQEANTGDPEPFIGFIAHRVYEAQKEYLRLLDDGKDKNG